MPISRGRKLKIGPMAPARRAGDRAIDLSTVVKLTWGDLPDDPSGLDDPRMQTVINEQRRQFSEKFGREPGLADPIMFDPDAEMPRFHSQTEIRAEMIATMKRAGIRPALIYIYEKTGLIVSEDNKHLLSPSQKRAWKTAAAEYERDNPA